MKRSKVSLRAPVTGMLSLPGSHSPSHPPAVQMERSCSFQLVARNSSAERAGNISSYTHLSVGV